MHIWGGSVLLPIQHIHRPLSPLVCSYVTFKLQLNVTSPLHTLLMFLPPGRITYTLSAFLQAFDHNF